MYKKLVYILLLGFVWGVDAQNGDFKSQLDSIQKLRRLSNNINLDIQIRINYAKNAVILSNRTKVDSVILHSNKNLAHVYFYDNRLVNKAKKILHKNLQLAQKINDTISLSHMNLYLGYVYYTSKVKNDSAYYYFYNTLKLLDNLKTPKEKFRKIETLIYIAHLQRKGKDYLGSQSTTINAFKQLNQLSQDEDTPLSLIEIYDLLALNLHSIKEYKKAIEYYNKSLEISNNKNVPFKWKLYTKINLAELYKEKGNYENVFNIYNELLQNNTLLKRNPSSYGAIINNIAYTMFLSKDKNIFKTDSLFTKAHTIFEDLQFPYELSASSNDMSEFYTSIEKKEKALFYAQKAYKTSKDIQEYEEQLRALKQLSKLNEGEEGKKYLYEYIKLNDSLINNERANRNKFARIQFETDEYIRETKRLNTQNILISTIAGTVILILGLLYFIKRQNSKNSQLVFESEQQHSNQEIYNLLLNQQTKLEEGRLLERHRIAEEMHDGILSHLFGTRMGLGFLDLKGNNNTLNKYDKFINELQKVEDDIRNVSHELKKDEVFSKNNFETIIEQFLEQQSHLGHFKYEIIKDTPSVFDQVHDNKKVAVYRMLQETIQNIIKHAEANKVTLNFSLNANTLKLVITDNGIGFNTEKKHQGIGLKNIRSRITKLNGIINIKSNLNKGTTINILIPNIKI